eukprot:Partr_v1_DN26937_c2_g1_i1_m6716 putative cystinosin
MWLTANLISQIVGWTYFTSWSISFYPQLFLNFRRKSCDGLSYDFVIYNVLGFGCYFVRYNPRVDNRILTPVQAYTAAFYWSDQVRSEYRERHGGSENLVKLNDLIFAMHALILTILTYLQTLIYRPAVTYKASLFSRFLVLIAVAVVVLMAGTTLYGWTMWLDLVCSSL